MPGIDPFTYDPLLQKTAESGASRIIYHGGTISGAATAARALEIASHISIPRQATHIGLRGAPSEAAIPIREIIDTAQVANDEPGTARKLDNVVAAPAGYSVWLDTSSVSFGNLDAESNLRGNADPITPIGNVGGHSPFNTFITERFMPNFTFEPQDLFAPTGGNIFQRVADVFRPGQGNFGPADLPIPGPSTVQAGVAGALVPAVTGVVGAIGRGVRWLVGSPAGNILTGGAIGAGIGEVIDIVQNQFSSTGQSTRLRAVLDILKANTGESWSVKRIKASVRTLGYTGALSCLPISESDLCYVMLRRSRRRNMLSPKRIQNCKGTINSFKRLSKTISKLKR